MHFPAFVFAYTPIAFLTAIAFAQHSLSSPLAHQDRSFPFPVLDDGNAILNKDLDPQIFHRLGQYAARYSVADSPKAVDKLLPPQCKVRVVNSLERHGARYMTANALASAQSTIAKVQTALQQQVHDQNALPEELRFLANFSLQTGTADLVPYGALQAYYSGRSTASVYPALALNGKLPFVRASGDEDTLDDRVIVTAKYWTLGFTGGAFPQGPLINSTDVRSAAASFREPDVVFSEMKNQNNTLDVSTCPAEDAIPDAQGEKGAQKAFAQSTILPTVGKRLSDRLASAGVTNLSLSATDMINFASICSFDTYGRATVRQGRLSIRQSDVCGMFNATEWTILGYAFDVGKWQGAGYGNPFYKALGQGFLRELLARFTGAPLDLTQPTSLNATVDGNSDLFPVPRRDPHRLSYDGPQVFFDGSHDNNVGPIVAAAGLFDGPALQTTPYAQDAPHNWVFSQIAPLQGKVVFEKVECLSGVASSQDYIRIRVNGATLDAKTYCGVNGADTSVRSAQLCPLSVFADKLAFVQSAQEWNRCYQ